MLFYPEGSETMFEVRDGTQITISRGDTGALKIKINAVRADTGDPYIFGERDRALFTIKSNNGDILKQKAYQVDENGEFIVVFLNADTQNFPAGTNYSWDVRCVINPYYDTDPPSGEWPEYDNLTFPVSAGDKCMHSGTYYIALEDISTSETWTPGHWMCVDYRVPVDGDQVLTPTDAPLNAMLLSVVGEI